jgi:hypothetical protein
VNKRRVSASMANPKLVAPRDLLRFISKEHVHGKSLMKFVPVAYSNCSGPVKAEYGAPAPFAHALNGVGLCCFMLYFQLAGSFSRKVACTMLFSEHILGR